MGARSQELGVSLDAAKETINENLMVHTTAPRRARNFLGSRHTCIRQREPPFTHASKIKGTWDVAVRPGYALFYCFPNLKDTTNRRLCALSCPHRENTNFVLSPLFCSNPPALPSRKGEVFTTAVTLQICHRVGCAGLFDMRTHTQEKKRNPATLDLFRNQLSGQHQFFRESISAIIAIGPCFSLIAVRKSHKTFPQN